MKWPAITSTGATNSAICIDEPMAMPRARSILPFMATRMAVECSAALPTMATTTTPMNTLLMPMAAPASPTACTRNSLIQPTNPAATTRTAMLLPTDQTGPSCASSCALAVFAREQVLVALQLEEQARGVGQQQHPGDVEAQGLDVRRGSCAG